MISLNENIVFLSFIAFTIIGLLFKVISFYKRRNSPTITNLIKFQFLYFLCYYSFMIGLMFQGPYVYQRYIDCGMETKQISIIMSTFNIVSSFWGLLVGYFTTMIGHKKMIIFSAFFLGLHAVCRCIGGFKFFVASSFLMGISTASNKVVFEDWLMISLNNRNVPENFHATIQENSALLKLLITLFITPISSNVTKKYGSSGAFLTSSLLFFLSSMIILLFLPNVKKDEIKQKKIGYLQALNVISKSIIQSKELLCLLAGDFFYNVYLLLYTPKWVGIHQINKKEKLPLSQISSANSIALMVGAQIFSLFINKFSYKFTLFVNFGIYVISIYCIILFYNNKNFVFFFYMISSICDGGAGMFLRILRSRIYPKEVRSYILGFLRVPTSLTVSFILILLNNASILTILKTSSLFLTLTVLISFILFFMEKQ